MAVQFLIENQDFLDAGPHPYARNVEGVTLMAWIKPRTIPSGSIRVVMGISIGPPPGISGLSRASLEIGGNGTNATLISTMRRLDSDVGAQVTDLTPIVPIVVGNWYHVVAAIDYTTTPGITRYSYVNGQFSSTEQQSADAEGGGSSSDTDCKVFTIGADEGGLIRFYDGDIDDARIYNRLVSLEEIQTIYASKGADSIINKIAGRFPLHELGNGQSVIGAISVAELSAAFAAPVNNPIYVPGITVQRGRPRISIGF